jgi:hypothetical protein
MLKPTALLLFLCFAFPAFSQQAPESWRFAVSGDSRNCGDVVMPAIAQSVLDHHARFYWHMGDFRAMYGVDEDIQKRYDGKLPMDEYLRIAWQDFLANQVAPFGNLPVHLGIGNHELAGGKIIADFTAQFAYWLDTPELRARRLEESPQDPTLKTYYDWKEGNVDFIYLDNSGDNGFDDLQMQWFEKVLASDKIDDGVKSVVVGMHRALSNSLACGHSMNGDQDSPSVKGTQSGRRAYTDLLNWKKETHKFVYILASHSHFYMQDLYDTPYWNNPEHGGEVLPGWIVGTAGAQRYALPDLTPEQKEKTKAETRVWGYLLGTVKPNGEITFEFEKLGKDSVPKIVRDRYGDDFVDNFCYAGNKTDAPHPPAPSCNDK